MHGAVVAVLLDLSLVGACEGGEDRESEKSGASTAQRRSEAVLIRTSLKHCLGSSRSMRAGCFVTRGLTTAFRRPWHG